MADDTTVTIAIKANIEAFKKAMQEAAKSVKTAGENVSRQARKVSEDIKENIDAKRTGFKDFKESIKGISPMFDSVIGTIEEMKSRLEGAGKAGRLAILGVKMAVAGLAAGIFVMLGKAILDVSGKFAKLADPARYDKAASEMKESIRTLKTSIGELASPVFEYLAKGVTALAKGLTWVVERIQMFVGLLQGLLGIGHKVNQTLNGTAKGMDKAGAAADAGLAAFDSLNSLNIQEMGDMDHVEKMAKSMDDMRKKGAEIAASIRDALKPARDFINGLKELFSMSPRELWDGFVQAAADAWNGVSTWAGNTWQGIKASIQGTWADMKGWAAGAWDSVKSMASDAWTGISETIKGAWDGVKDYLISKFQDVGTALKGMFRGTVDFFKRAWDSVFGAINGAIRWITDKVEWLMNKVHGVRDSLGGIGGRISGAIGGFVEGVKGVLGFAKGGLFQPNNPQLVMVGDNKSEPEVIAPRSMIVDAMREVMAEYGASGGQSRDITLMIDGRVLARSTFDEFENEGRRRGTGAMI